MTDPLAKWTASTRLAASVWTLDALLLLALIAFALR
jgi:hypothetical protein